MSPVAGRDRIQSLDVIRGVALFGILLMNIVAYAMPLAAYSNPTVWGGDTGANLWAWILSAMFIGGTQRGLFSLLFGAGFILLITGLEAKGRSDAADIYFRRSLWLIVFGVIHAYLFLWPGDVLFFYGMTAVLLYPFRKLSARAMLLIAAASLAANTLWGIGEFNGVKYKWERAQAAEQLVERAIPLSVQQQADVAAWKAVEKQAKPDAFELQKEIAAHQGSYLDLFEFTAPISATFESWYRYRYFFDVLGMMLIGMALFKLGVLTLKRRSRDYVAMMIIGGALGLTLKYREVSTALEGGFSALATAQAHWSYDVARAALTMGYVGALLLFCRSGWLPWLQKGLAATGRMALTNYMGQSLICALIFSGFGLGLYGKLERYELFYVVGLIWLFHLISCPLWLARYRYGPLEWLWRSLTYVERQPFLRHSDKPAHDVEPMMVKRPHGDVH